MEPWLLRTTVTPDTEKLLTFSFRSLKFPRKQYILNFVTRLIHSWEIALQNQYSKKKNDQKRLPSATVPQLIIRFIQICVCTTKANVIELILYIFLILSSKNLETHTHLQISSQKVMKMAQMSIEICQCKS